MTSDRWTRRAAIHLATALIYLAIGCSIGVIVAWCSRPQIAQGSGTGRAESITETLHLPVVTILAFADVQQGPATFSKLLDHTFPQATHLLGVGDYVQNGCPQRCDEWWPFVNTFAGRDFSRLRDIALARGNHDGGYWQMWGWPLFGGSWYQRQWGNVCLVVIDSGEEVPIRYSLLGGGAQREWLRAVTRSVAWTSARWRVAAFHHPPRTSLWEGVPPCYYPNRQELDETVTLLESAGCDLVLCGHAHGYQRGKLGSMLFVISGGGGGYLDHWCRSDSSIELALAVHNVLLIEATDMVLAVRAIGVDGKEIDRVTR